MKTFEVTVILNNGKEFKTAPAMDKNKRNAKDWADFLVGQKEDWEFLTLILEDGSLLALTGGAANNATYIIKEKV